MAGKKTGRPSKFQPEFVEQAKKLCALGATDKDLAGFFHVSVPTIWRWSCEHEGFCNALKVGKAEADERVERSLYHKATGYTFESVKIFQYEGAPVTVPFTEHIPPDTTACIFWLKNRRPDLWRDVSRVDHTGKVEVEHTDAREFIASRIAGVASRIGEDENPQRTNGKAVH
jgi:hypothetical protein